MSETVEQGRIETGPLQIDDDWPGTFIRGDNAFGYAMALEPLLAVVKAKLPMEGGVWLSVAQCEGLLRLLQGSRVDRGQDPEGLQRITRSQSLERERDEARAERDKAIMVRHIAETSRQLAIDDRDRAGLENRKLREALEAHAPNHPLLTGLRVEVAPAEEG